MKYLSCLALLLLVSCGSGEVVRKNIDEDSSYRTSGVEQFFLPQLPDWANFSESGRCFKNTSLNYLNFNKLSQKYDLNYQQMIELQAQYNERIENYFRSTAERFLRPVEEASFFSNTLEQVRGGVRSLRIPKVSNVEVIWLESYLSDGKLKELKVLAKAGRFDEKLPILFSSCHSKQSLNQWLIENSLDEVGFYLVGAEWLSPYSADKELRPGLKLNLQEIIGKEIKISFLTANNKIPQELNYNKE